MVEKYTRYGYVLGPFVIVLKVKAFARWQEGEGVADSALCMAVREMSSGLCDADLGGGLYKKRIARPGSGKSGAYRVILSVRVGKICVFLHGFAKSERSNITPAEKRALQLAGRAIMEMTESERVVALISGAVLEVCCEQYDH